MEDNYCSNDDMFLNFDDLENDNLPSKVEDAAVKVIGEMKKLLNEIELNIKFNEEVDKETNLSNFSFLTGILIDLMNMNEEELSEEEIDEKIAEALQRTTELTYSNMDRILPEEEKEKVKPNTDSDTSSDLDW